MFLISVNISNLVSKVIFRSSDVYNICSLSKLVVHDISTTLNYLHSFEVTKLKLGALLNPKELLIIVKLDTQYLSFI